MRHKPLEHNNPRCRIISSPRSTFNNSLTTTNVQRRCPSSSSRTPSGALLSLSHLPQVLQRIPPCGFSSACADRVQLPHLRAASRGSGGATKTCAYFLLEQDSPCGIPARGLWETAISARASASPSPITSHGSHNAVRHHAKGSESKCQGFQPSLKCAGAGGGAPLRVGGHTCCFLKGRGRNEPNHIVTCSCNSL